MKIYKWKILIVLIALVFVIIGCSKDSSSEDTNTNDKTEESSKSEKDTSEGGELRVALNAQPPTLDQPMDPAAATRDTSRLMYETLVTIDSNHQAVPMLAKSIDISDDGKIYTFQLREGVKFHNGKEMISEDIVSSMYRWMEKSSITGAIFNDATWEAEDDYTVVLELAQPSVLTLDTMASAKQAAAIMPKEIIEEAPPEGVSEYVGTGPFKFVEWKQDQYIHFTKFDEYQPSEGDADGLAGKKEALVDDIYFDIVTDATTRLSGLQTGQYDIIYQVPYDNYKQVKEDPNMEPYMDAYGELIFIYNKIEGL